MKEYLFPKRLKLLREKIGITQSELAECLNVKRQLISYYENGNRIPDAQFVYKLSDITGCSSDYLLGISDSMRAKYDPVVEQLGLDELAASNIGLSNDTVVLNLLLKEDVFWELIHVLRLVDESNLLKETQKNPYFFDALNSICHHRLEKVIEFMMRDQSFEYSDIEKTFREAELIAVNRALEEIACNMKPEMTKLTKSVFDAKKVKHMSDSERKIDGFRAFLNEESAGIKTADRSE